MIRTLLKHNITKVLYFFVFIGQKVVFEQLKLHHTEFIAFHRN